MLLLLTIDGIIHYALKIGVSIGCEWIHGLRNFSTFYKVWAFEQSLVRMDLQFALILCAPQNVWADGLGWHRLYVHLENLVKIFSWKKIIEFIFSSFWKFVSVYTVWLGVEDWSKSTACDFLVSKKCCLPLFLLASKRWCVETCRKFQQFSSFGVVFIGDISNEWGCFSRPISLRRVI